MNNFVKLDESLLSSDAWAFLKSGAKVLYIELKRKFNGSNNGSIIISSRDGAYLLGVTKDTVSGYFKELESVGLIRKASDGKVGPSGIGESPKWIITELPVNTVKPKKSNRVFDKKSPPKFVATRQMDDGLLVDGEVLI